MTEGNSSPVRLRAQLRGDPSRGRACLSPDRTAKCGLVRRGKAEVVIGAAAGGTHSARWAGMVTCQSVHACPVCAKRIRLRRASQVRAAVEEGRARCKCHGCALARKLGGDRRNMPREARCTGPRWRMLTVTLRHDAGLPLSVTKKLVMGAYRAARMHRSVRDTFDGPVVERVRYRTKKGKWAWQEVREGGRVKATIRAAEVTDGQNGWHPHIHVLMLTDEWTLAERLAFELTYEKYIRKFAEKAGISVARVAPKLTVLRRDGKVARNGVALKWSNAKVTQKEIERSGYLAKLGWEAAGIGKGDPQWAIARKAAAGDARAISRWREYTDAMKGTRAIECDERAADFASAKAAALTGDDATLDPVELRVEIGPFRLLTMKDAERFNPEVTRDVLLAAARAGPSEWRVLAAFDAVMQSSMLRSRHEPLSDLRSCA